MVLHMWVRFLPPLPKIRKSGRVWLMASVLKTEEPRGSVGSNPTSSANIALVAQYGQSVRFVIGGSWVQILPGAPNLGNGQGTQEILARFQLGRSESDILHQIPVCRKVWLIRLVWGQETASSNLATQTLKSPVHQIIQP